MRILCLCRSGRVRSHAMKVAVEFRGHEALNAGVLKATPETLKLLCDWANLVLVAEEWMIDKLDTTKPIINLDLGPDIWRTRVNDDLLKTVQKALKKVRKNGAGEIFS